MRRQLDRFLHELGTVVTLQHQHVMLRIRLRQEEWFADATLLVEVGNIDVRASAVVTARIEHYPTAVAAPSGVALSQITIARQRFCCAEKCLGE